jgi:hypothetical protein
MLIPMVETLQSSLESQNELFSLKLELSELKQEVETNRSIDVDFVKKTFTLNGRPLDDVVKVESVENPKGFKFSCSFVPSDGRSRILDVYFSVDQAT